MGNIFDTLLINPMTNVLMLLYGLLGNSYVLAIIVLTIIIRLLTLPLTLRQLQYAVAIAETRSFSRAAELYRQACGMGHESACEAVVRVEEP